MRRILTAALVAIAACLSSTVATAGPVHAQVPTQVLVQTQVYRCAVGVCASVYNNGPVKLAVGERSWRGYRLVPPHQYSQNAGVLDAAYIHAGAGWCMRRSVMMSSGWWGAESVEMRGPVTTGIGYVDASFRVYRC